MAIILALIEVMGFGLAGGGIALFCCFICDKVVERRQRRLALQRALVIQAADQRMRAASQQALGAMLHVVNQRFDRR